MYILTNSDSSICFVIQPRTRIGQRDLSTCHVNSHPGQIAGSPEPRLVEFPVQCGHSNYYAQCRRHNIMIQQTRMSTPPPHRYLDMNHKHSVFSIDAQMNPRRPHEPTDGLGGPDAPEAQNRAGPARYNSGDVRGSLGPALSRYLRSPFSSFIVCRCSRVGFYWAKEERCVRYLRKPPALHPMEMRTSVSAMLDILNVLSRRNIGELFDSETRVQFK